MKTSKIKLLTENTPENYFLQALFLKERRSKLVSVSSMFLPNETVRAAELSLLQHPKRPVALVLNAGQTVPEKIEKRRRALNRILSNISNGDNWHLCLANPGVLTWVLTDPEVKAKYDATPDPDRPDFCLKLPLLIGAMAEQNELDRGKIGEAHPEFLELVEFIERHAPAPAPAQAQAT